ncbi:hypothetical protein MBLNU230_g7604t1 [Neophaeotheca triangularis]
MVNFPKIAVFASSFLPCVIAHPGEHLDHAQIKREATLNSAVAEDGAHALSKCQNSIKARALNQRAIARRAAKAQSLRQAKQIDATKLARRDAKEIQYWQQQNHNQTCTCIPHDDTAADLFGATTSCILAPEQIVGPYYVAGELIRQNITEGQSGVPMHFEMQFVDVNTCEPVPALYIDVWGANATGVYSGVTSGPGILADQFGHQAGLDTSFLRGVQITDEEGVAAFDTIFPGHYDERATHEHVRVAGNVSATYINGTFEGGRVEHIGQIYFPEKLRSAVEATYPYNTNEIEVTSNVEDEILNQIDLSSFDPFIQYQYLGDEVEDGLLAWISIGINTAANHTANSWASARRYQDGAIEVEAPEDDDYILYQSALPQ